jgi:hypothetical protein
MDHSMIQQELIELSSLNNKKDKPKHFFYFVTFANGQAILPSDVHNDSTSN